MTVLGQVAVAQGLHGLSVLLLVLHVACGGAELGPGWGRGHVFFSSKCHHIHLLLQALGRMKKETSRNHLSHSSHHCFPLHCVLKALRLLRMMEHLVSQSVLGRVLRGTFLRTQIVPRDALQAMQEKKAFISR